MTIEEKIEVMFESILSEMENISKKLGGTDLGKLQSGSSGLKQKFDALSEKILNLKIPLNKPDLNPIHEKLDAIVKQLKTSKTVLGPGDLGSQHRSLFAFRRSGIILIIIVLFSGSLGLNFYLADDYDQYKEGYQKYQFIYYSGNKEYLDELDSLWRIESIRSDYLQFVEKRKMEISLMGHKQINDGLKLKIK